MNNQDFTKFTIGFFLKTQEDLDPFENKELLISHNKYEYPIVNMVVKIGIMCGVGCRFL